MEAKWNAEEEKCRKRDKIEKSKDHHSEDVETQRFSFFPLKLVYEIVFFFLELYSHDVWRAFLFQARLRAEKERREAEAKRQVEEEKRRKIEEERKKHEAELAKIRHAEEMERQARLCVDFLCIRQAVWLYFVFHFY